VELKEANFILFVICAFLAEILGTIGGFGSSMLFVPVANFFMDFQSVLGITAVFHVFSNVSKLFLFKNHLNWKTIALIGIPSVIFVLIGSYLSNAWNSNILPLILGIFLILFSILYFLKPNLKLKARTSNYLIFGGFAGFTAGLIGTGGAIRGYALASMNFSKEVFVGSSAAIDFGVDLARSIVYWEHGYLHSHDWKYILALFFIATLGSWIGKLLLEKIDQIQFQKTVMLLVLISGLLLIVKYFNS
jgi:uncharacterized protein